MEKQDEIARLLRKLAQCVENSTLDELQALLDGKRRLRIEAEMPTATQARTARKGVTGTLDLDNIEHQLRSLTSREEGKRLIEGLSKSELEQLARAMKLPVARHDTLERLKEKIVESGIGARLSSQAIRGTG